MLMMKRNLLWRWGVLVYIVKISYAFGFQQCHPMISWKQGTPDHQESILKLASSSIPSTRNTTTFSRTFPRYRIELTRERDIVDERAKFQWPWQAKNRRAGLLELRNITTSVATVSTLWRWLADVSDSPPPSTKRTISLPNAPIKTVQQWVDMANWMSEQRLSPLTARFCPQLNGVELSVPSRIHASSTTHFSPNMTIPSHNVITQRTKAWVRRILVDLGICPFTKSETRSGHGVAGVPVAKISYHTSYSATVPALLADAWEAMAQMLEAGPLQVSSILLAAPRFDDDFALWAGPVFTLLETSVVVASATKDLGVVCFHPTYQTPDGTSWPGFGHMHSVPRLRQWTEGLLLSDEDVAQGGAWQRRTPHATINVLRADQLALAEGKRSTPELYAENIGKLLAIADQLPLDLERERNIP